MEEYCALRDLLELLERDHKFHICLHFFNKSMYKKFDLTRRNRVHDNPFCDLMKKLDPKHDKCLLCRQKALAKACTDKKPFSGLCRFGAFETVYPVFLHDAPLCVIFVGNIISDETSLLERSGLLASDPVLSTMQRNMTEALCMQVSKVVASYITEHYERLEEQRERSIHATVAAIRDYVDNFFYQAISLDELSKRYHYNEKYLGTLFKQEMGMSFRDYLNQQRLSFAKALLRNSSTNMVDVASRSGFNNVTYFNRVFKNQFGMTPSQYRERPRHNK